MFKKITFFINSIILISLLILFSKQSSIAQENKSQPPVEKRFEAEIVSIEKETIIDENQKEKNNLIYKLKGLDGDFKDKNFEIKSLNLDVAYLPEYKEGDKVIVSLSKDFEGKDIFFINDYVRRNVLFWLFAGFVFLTVIIGKKRGLGSIFGLAISFLVIFNFILPQILSGKDPILITIIASLFIIPVTYYFSHGFNLKTHIAIFSTLVALSFSGLMADFFVDWARLSGFVSEEAGFLQAMKPNLINIKGLLMAGIIIGMIGVIDDITIAQAAIVDQLKKASPNIKFNELYSRAMNVGKDHIASMVNTLILVYTGAAMPLLLLFVDNPSPFTQVINHEVIAEEIVRTLVASIGLILAVPITTLIASFYAQYDKNLNK